jgi:hypothetical protein
MPIKTRKPTGKPPWPVVLLAGAEKVGKSYACAVASASKTIGRTFWIGIGEDDPDEYGAIDGARFEIVDHDGSFQGILAAIEAAKAEPAEDGKPNMIVVDSIGRLWDMLSDEAQHTANQRAANKARRFNKSAPEDDVQISMDLWNKAKNRWQQALSALKDHPGPVLLTARLEQTAVMNDRGEPTGEKVWKVKAEKNLAFDVGAVVQIQAFGDYRLTGVRSLKHKATPGAAQPYRDFTVEKLWADLGLVGKDATTPRQHKGASGEASLAGEAKITDDQLAQLGTLLRGAGWDKETALRHFSEWTGRQITGTKELTEAEAQAIMPRLQSADPWEQRKAS